MQNESNVIYFKKCYQITCLWTTCNLRTMFIFETLQDFKLLCNKNWISLIKIFSPSKSVTTSYCKNIPLFIFRSSRFHYLYFISCSTSPENILFTNDMTCMVLEVFHKLFKFKRNMIFCFLVAKIDNETWWNDCDHDHVVISFSKRVSSP